MAQLLWLRHSGADSRRFPGRRCQGMAPISPPYPPQNLSAHHFRCQDLSCESLHKKPAIRRFAGFSAFFLQLFCKTTPHHVLHTARNPPPPTPTRHNPRSHTKTPPNRRAVAQNGLIHTSQQPQHTSLPANTHQAPRFSAPFPDKTARVPTHQRVRESRIGVPRPRQKLPTLVRCRYAARPRRCGNCVAWTHLRDCV